MCFQVMKHFQILQNVVLYLHVVCDNREIYFLMECRIMNLGRDWEHMSCGCTLNILSINVMRFFIFPKLYVNSLF